MVIVMIDSLDLCSFPVICWLGIVAGCSLLNVYTDIRYYWIPDRIVLVMAAGNGAACLFRLVQPDWILSLACLAGLGIAAFVLPGSIGWGDIKLIGALSLGSSGMVLYSTLCVAFGTALAGAVMYWIVYREKVIPFAPFLISGWWLSFFFAGEWIAWAGLLM